MKNILAALAVAAMLASSGLIYAETMEVKSVAGDQLILETSNGNVYVKDDADGWEVGDLASVLMFSNGTQKVNDDVILAAQYSGFTVANTARP